MDALNRIRTCKITAIVNQKGTTILARPSWHTFTDDEHSFCVIVSHSGCHRLLDMSDLRPLRLSSCLLHPLPIPYSQPGRQFTLISLSEPVQSFTNILIHTLRGWWAVVAYRKAAHTNAWHARLGRYLERASCLNIYKSLRGSLCPSNDNSK